MNIDSINRGVVIDHIDPGKGMELVRLLNLDELTCTVAVIRNARSGKTGRKDIVKIEDEVDLNFDVIGFLDPNITVNIIVDGSIVKKLRIDPPKCITNVIKCKNPRCITSSEESLPQEFCKVGDGMVYRCVYCEQEYTPSKQGGK